MYGNKYDPKRSLTDVAKGVRADIKAAMKAATASPFFLPTGLRTSVRGRHFANGRSLDVTVTGFPEPFLNPAAVLWSRVFPHEPQRFTRLTREAARVVAVLEHLLEAYNFDKSDLASDLFHVSFYGSVSFDSELDRWCRSEVLDSREMSTVEMQAASWRDNGIISAAFDTIARRDLGYRDYSTERGMLHDLLSTADAP